MTSSNNIEYILGITSCFLCSFIILIVLSIGIYNHKLVNGLSLRLTTGISAGLLLLNITLIIIRKLKNKDDICPLLGMFRAFFTLFYTYLIGVMALNMHLTFVLGYKYNSKWELYYWSTSFLSSLIPALVVYYLDRFGHSKELKTCFLNQINSISTMFVFTLLYTVPIGIISFYCIYVMVMSLLAYIKKTKGLENLKFTLKKEDIKLINNIKTKMINILIRVYPSPK